MNGVQACVEFLKHRDIFEKNIVDIKKIADNRFEISTKTKETWLVCHNEILPSYTKIFVGVIQTENVIEIVNNTKADARVRILIFDKQGKKITHIVPYHLRDKNKEQINQFIQTIISHGTE